MLTHSALLAERRHKSHMPVRKSVLVCVCMRIMNSYMLPYFWVNVSLCVLFFANVACVCMLSSLYSTVFVHVCVCLTDFQQSSDQPGTSPRQQGQSHSLIILTFLYNDPTHNSLFSGFFPLPPSICLTDAYHFTHSIYSVLDLMSLLTSFFSRLTVLSFLNPQQFSRLLTLLRYIFPHLFSLL